MTRKKRMLVVALVAAVLGLAAFAVMAAKDRTYVPSAPYSGLPTKELDVFSTRDARWKVTSRARAC